MAGSGKSRNTPCFCGSGRKLKHCCARSLKRVRTWTLPGSSCRWRFWEAHGLGVERFAGEVGEHVCTGERVWVARGTPDGTTWMIDQGPVSLLEVIDCLPVGLYDWVIEQTLAALGGGRRRGDARAEVEPASSGGDDTDSMDESEFAEVRDLMLELLRLVHASDVVAARLGLDGHDSEPGDQTALERVSSSVAA